VTPWQKFKAWLTAHSDFMNSVVFLAAMAHVGWATIIVLAPQFVLGTDLKLATWTSIILTAFAAAKEFIYDANIERPVQSTKDNVQDFVGYLGGIALAWILIGFSIHFHAHGAVTVPGVARDSSAAVVLLGR
jgi:hypothetical protein